MLTKLPYQQNRVYDTDGIVPALSAQLSKPMIISNKPRNGDPQKGGAGLLKSDKHSFTIDSQTPHKVFQKTHGSSVTIKEDHTGTIQAGGNNVQDKVPSIFQQGQLRYLTEIECERLQYYPDDWTAFGDYYGKIIPIAKTNRYKLIGNSVTVKIVEIIGKRILNRCLNQ